MKIISKRMHSYGAKDRRPGTLYEATKEHAAFLVKLGLAEYPTKGTSEITLNPPPDYATRQVKAEDKDARAVDAEAFKGSYKRRDMKAEK